MSANHATVETSAINSSRPTDEEIKRRALNNFNYLVNGFIQYAKSSHIKCRGVENGVNVISHHISNDLILTVKDCTKGGIINIIRPFVSEKSRERMGTSFYLEFLKYINSEYCRTKKHNKPSDVVKNFIDEKVLCVHDQNYLKRYKNTMTQIQSSILNVCDMFNVNPNIMYVVSGFYFAVYLKGTMSMDDAIRMFTNNIFFRQYFTKNEIAAIIVSLKKPTSNKYFTVYNQIVFQMFI